MAGELFFQQKFINAEGGNLYLDVFNWIIQYTYLWK